MSEDRQTGELVERVGKKYKGHAKLMRLKFMAERSEAGSKLQQDAYVSLLDELRRPGGLNTEMYARVVRAASDNFPNNPRFVIDEQFLVMAKKEASTLMQKLESELGEAKARALRDQTRVSTPIVF